jgi:hypothetical protein
LAQSTSATAEKEYDMSLRVGFVRAVVAALALTAVACGGCQRPSPEVTVEVAGPAGDRSIVEFTSDLVASGFPTPPDSPCPDCLCWLKSKWVGPAAYSVAALSDEKVPPGTFPIKHGSVQIVTKGPTKTTTITLEPKDPKQPACADKDGYLEGCSMVFKGEWPMEGNDPQLCVFLLWVDSKGVPRSDKYWPGENHDALYTSKTSTTSPK